MPSQTLPEKGVGVEQYDFNVGLLRTIALPRQMSFEGYIYKLLKVSQLQRVTFCSHKEVCGMQYNP